jgi:diguanylate cyclase (GGDEF)-like protein
MQIGSEFNDDVSVPHTQKWRELAALVGASPSLASAAHVLSRGLAQVLQSPLALLSRDSAGWHFEADGFPEHAIRPALRVQLPTRTPGALPELRDATGRPWTGIVLGQVREREWMLMVPGDVASWRESPDLEVMVEQLAAGLARAADNDDHGHGVRLKRRMFAFSRRLARENDPGSVHRIVLRTLASQVQAQTGALAIYVQNDQALAISATHGYPHAIVEHLRIPPGDGILGSVFTSGRPVLRQSLDEPDQQRRLRYRTNSYMVLPLVAGSRRLAVVALTDRADGRAFDSRDFEAARVLAANAALAFSRERLTENLTELTRIATVDAVTGLFNRRYFEGRLEAEVQRARRQRQDLGLLMIDIDDFKRINDTWGHLEGDRALRDVADLLRSGVRIFDVCARYGGEEFVIVMPGATAQVALHVAERIRRHVEQHSAHDPLPITVSIGVGMLGAYSSVDDLIATADRALIGAKTAGKNRVWIDDQNGDRTRQTP